MVDCVKKFNTNPDGRVNNTKKTMYEYGEIVPMKKPKIVL